MVIAEYHPATNPATLDPADNGDGNFQVPMVDIAHETRPIDSRDRADGGHLDRTAWAYDFCRTYNAPKPARAVLGYMVFRAMPQRLFQCDDSEEQIADWTGYERKAVGRAIQWLMNNGALYQTRTGQGGDFRKSVTSRYRLRGVDTGWRLDAMLLKTNGTPGLIAPNQWDSGSHCSSTNETRSPDQRDPESRPMRPGVPPHPYSHPYSTGVKDSKESQTTKTTTRETGAATAAVSSSSEDKSFRESGERTTGYDGSEYDIAADLDALDTEFAAKDSAGLTSGAVCDYNAQCSEPAFHLGLCVAHAVECYWPRLDTGSFRNGIHGALKTFTDRSRPDQPELLAELVGKLQVFDQQEAAEEAFILAQQEAAEAKAEQEARAAEEAAERHRLALEQRAAEEAALEARLTPDQKAWRAAHKQIARGRFGSAGSLLRDVDVESVEICAGALVLPFKTCANRGRFQAGLEEHGPALLVVLRAELPDVERLQPFTLPHDETRCLTCKEARRAEERKAAAAMIRDHVTDWEFDPDNPTGKEK